MKLSWGTNKYVVFVREFFFKTLTFSHTYDVQYSFHWLLSHTYCNITFVILLLSIKPMIQDTMLGTLFQENQALYSDSLRTDGFYSA